MSDIVLLPDSLINRIAAGEVIERPASVVKELLENAIDSGAAHIDIEIADGGKKSILVKDDGCGIAPDDLLLAVSRHATSKIKTDDDLFSIHTLGFRGEALASIASVAKLTLTSRSRKTEEPAHEIRIEGGEIISESEAGHPFGTTVSVRYLFYKTPARLKFLKGTETEMTHIVDHVTKVALGNPQCAIRLHHNGKKILDTEGSPDLIKKVSDLFGKDIADNCYPIKIFSSASSLQSASPIEISGLVGHPQISRSHQKNLFILVNGRAVRDKVIFHAVMEAYRNLLMHGKYPFVVLNLNVSPEAVDVNVHPAKAEVRFADGQGMHRLVYETLRQTLEAEPWNQNSTGLEEPSWISMTSSKPLFSSSPTSQSDFDQPSRTFNSLPYAQRPVLHAKTESDFVVKNVSQTRVAYSGLNVIGQLMGTYLVCEGEGKLVLIDQHAAHERVGFEKLLQLYHQGSIPSQQLLVPENVELKPAEAEILKKYLEELKTFGLDIEFFGGSTFMVRSVPSLFHQKVSMKDLILDLVGDVLEKGSLVSLKDRFHDLFASMSCHGAIRANHHLTIEEMRGLLKELSAYPLTNFCPHGRPVAIDVSQGELEKWFKRVV